MSKARDLANAGTALTTVSATELGYLDGVTSAVQTQMNAKLATATASSTYVPNSIVTTKGDILAATGSGTIVRQGVGTNGQLLSANSAQADGIEWVNAPSSAATISQIASGSLSGTSVVISSLTQDQLYLRISGALFDTSNAYMTVRINSNAGSLYNNVSTGFYTSGNVYNIWQFDNATAASYINLTTTTQTQNRTNADNNYWLKLTNCKSVGFTNYEFTSNYQSAAAGIANARGDGIFLDASQVTSIQILNSSGTAFTAGTYTLWGA
jgi:hypothetical protein